MSVLSDGSIESYCIYQGLISPYYKDQLQPASYDLTLEEVLGIDGKLPVGQWLLHGYTLQPGEFVLASTCEKVSLPSNIVGRLEGKSSLARKGLIIHTAGFIDPGFRGNITLEITNLGQEPFLLLPAMRIAQIAFQLLDKPAMRPYGHPELGSHYQSQVGATPSVL